MRNLTVSEVLAKIHRYEEENGFKPRTIELDDAAQLENLIQEVHELVLLRTEADPRNGKLTIAGVPVMLMSQILTID